MGFKYAPNEVIEDVEIPDGGRAYPGVTLSYSNYDGEFQIFRFCRVWETKGLTVEGRSIIRITIRIRLR